MTARATVPRRGELLELLHRQVGIRVRRSYAMWCVSESVDSSVLVKLESISYH